MLPHPHPHPQVIGDSLYWPRVSMGSSTTRTTKRQFKVLMRVRTNVNNLGPMPFLATVYRLDAGGVVTDLRQTLVTVQVTPGK